MAIEMHGRPATCLLDIQAATDELHQRAAPTGPGMTYDMERRTRARVLLRCPLRLYRRSSPKPIDGETLDLSSAGFYCVANESFFTGEQLDCILSVPADNSTFPAGTVNLHCEVTVTRTHERGDGYGMASRIDNYSLILKSDPDS